MALNNVPLAGQTLAQTRDPVRTNFSDINTQFAIDHVEFNTVNNGKHNKSTYPVQGVAPATIANEVALYSRTSTLTAVPELVIRRQSNGTIIEFTSSLQATPGWTFLPSGILLKWGTSSGTGNTTINFPVAATIPVFTQVFNAQITTSDAAITDTNMFVRLRSITTTQLGVYCSARTTVTNVAVNFNYLVIGV